jgi:undecaprenyl pyrophosphate phosphatase UppP
LRNLVSSAAAFIGGFLIGYNSNSDFSFGILLGVLILIPAILLSIATIYKRVNALYPESVAPYTVGLVFLQFINGYISESWIKTVSSIILLVFGCILIFKNSNIIEHEG